MSAKVASTSVLASLNYLSDLPVFHIERPYEIWLEKVPEGLEQTNVKFELYHDIPIFDVRSIGFNKFDIEKHGFEFLHQKYPDHCNISGSDSANASDEQRAAIVEYLQIMNDFLCKIYGGTKAVSYDWRIYTLPDEADARKIAIDVAHQVHADGSPNGIKKSLSYLLSSEEREEISQGKYRLRVINLWRPLVPVVDVQPIAMCDRRTVVDADWEEVEKIQTNWIEESMYLRRNKDHEWYWLSYQTMDEVTSLVVWDSERADDLTASVPHCAFEAPRSNSARQRESIEVRYLLWTPL